MLCSSPNDLAHCFTFSSLLFPEFRILIQILLFADAEQGLCYALLPFASVTEHVNVMLASLC